MPKPKESWASWCNLECGQIGNRSFDIKISRHSFVEDLSRLNAQLNFWNWLVILPRLFPRIKNRTLRQSARRNFLRQLRALRLSEENRLPSPTFPPIDLLSVAAGKDLETLVLCLKSAIKYSMNPISQVTVICPSHEVKRFERELLDDNFQSQIIIVDEDTVLPYGFRSKVKEHFGNRYGWVLQQFLSLDYILNSPKAGVLLINADTIMLRQVHWLSENGDQTLMVSTEYHGPYYELLSKLLNFPKFPRYTFITHHMLFQPALLRRIFEKRGYCNSMEILDAVIPLVKPNELSPLCIEFEPYGQGMIQDFPEKTYLRKFANCGIPRSKENLEMTEGAIGKLPQYNSVSFHDYL